MSTGFLICLLSFAAGPRPENATLLAAADFHGHACVCVETSDRILIGQKRGSAARLRAVTGKRLSVMHDHRHLWLVMPGGRRLTFTQEYLTPAFPQGSRCEQVVDRAIDRRNSTEPKTLRRR
jgi:hypothetical protein